MVFGKKKGPSGPEEEEPAIPASVIQKDSQKTSQTKESLQQTRPISTAQGSMCSKCNIRFTTELELEHHEVN